MTARIPNAQFHTLARVITHSAAPPDPGKGTVLIAAAGTADLPVAEEAAVCAEAMGNTVDRLYDVGVAGLHRLLAEHARLTAARVVIVVAGMEGALPSVVGGLVDVPVIAVPTSVGYGASFGGLAALLGMLNSCASGVSVVNIDNGFGAAAIASSINHLDCNAVNSKLQLPTPSEFHRRVASTLGVGSPGGWELTRRRRSHISHRTLPRPLT